MSEGKRPGGLTALAVLNFVFGGLNALGFIWMAFLSTFLNDLTIAGGEADEAQRELAKAWQEGGVAIFYVVLALFAVLSFLLIASGIGYLKQKKFLGRMVGNLSAVLSIVSSLVWALAVDEKADGGFSIGTISDLIYPLLTLVLINTMFKEDFVR